MVGSHLGLPSCSAAPTISCLRVVWTPFRGDSTCCCIRLGFCDCFKNVCSLWRTHFQHVFFFWRCVQSWCAMHLKRVTFSCENGTVSPKDYKRFVTIKTDTCLASCWLSESWISSCWTRESWISSHIQHHKVKQNGRREWTHSFTRHPDS